MKFFVKSEETGSRWEFDVDVDKSELKDLLNSDEWTAGPAEDILTEDWTKRLNGFDVFGLEDTELENCVVDLRSWFEEQGIDVDDIVYFQNVDPVGVAEENEEDFLENFETEDEALVEDVFEEIYDEEDY